MKPYVSRLLPITLVAATTFGVSLAIAPPLGQAAENSTCSAMETAAEVTAQVHGETLHLEGTDWCHATDGGSVLGVKIDGGLSRENPIHDNATIWHIINANADGTFSVDIPLPNSTEEEQIAGGKEFHPGKHTVTLLTGSLKSGDPVRSRTVEFTYGDLPPLETVSEDKSYRLRSQAAASSGGELQLHGEGWTTTEGGKGAQVVLKLNGLKADGTLNRYTQSGDKILKHPGTGEPDNTIWDIVVAQDDGTFDTTITLPEGLSAGQYLEVSASTGLREGDPQRDLGIGPLVVEGKEYIAPESGEQVACTPASESATAVVDPEKSTATSVHLTGTGWCNPVSGASRVAVKIDKGTFSRSNPVDSNATVWFLIDPDPSTGDFAVDIPLPNTSAEYASTKEFSEGTHTFTLLSGSLKADDPVRSVIAEFVVGEYRPNGIPDPLNNDEDLTEDAAGNVTVTRGGSYLTVSVPDGEPGDWVYLTLYNEGGTPNSFWGEQWFQLDSERQFMASLSGLEMTAQTWKAVVQSGNQGKRGELIGWDYYESPEPFSPDGLRSELDALAAAIVELDKTVTGATSTSAAPTSTTRPNTSSEPTVIRRTIQATGGTGSQANGQSTQTSGQPKPENTPELPVKRYADLKEGNAGDLEVAIVDEQLTITAAQTAANDWVYLRLYTFNGPVDLGWVQVDQTKAVRLNTSAIPDGEYRVTIQKPDAAMLGWVALNLVATTENLSGEKASTEERSIQATALPLDTRAMASTDWWLLAIGTLVPVLTAGAIAWWRRLIASPQQPLADATEGLPQR